MQNRRPAGERIQVHTSLTPPFRPRGLQRRAVHWLEPAQNDSSLRGRDFLPPAGWPGLTRRADPETIRPLVPSRTRYGQATVIPPSNPQHLNVLRNANRHPGNMSSTPEGTAEGNRQVLALSTRDGRGVLPVGVPLKESHHDQDDEQEDGKDDAEREPHVPAGIPTSFAHSAVLEREYPSLSFFFCHS